MSVENRLNQKITVPWEMTEPPVDPKQSNGSYQWPKNTVLKNDTDENTIGWPEGTISILHQAFDAKLSRFDKWQFSNDYPNFSALKMASKVFKRGVYCESQEVKTYKGQYDITVTNNTPRFQGAMVVVDQAVLDAWPQSFEDSTVLAVEALESRKNLQQLGEISRFLRTEGNISQTICIVGGGITADLAAFACALQNRSFILVPTTLLAMADACVGGKTGINFMPYGKNQLGLFAFPTEVVVARPWLSTLSQEHQRAGWWECIKHALLDKSLWEKLGSLEFRIPRKKQLLAIIETKVRVVKVDPTEIGARASLNLGHTLAHALEKLAQENATEKLTHGEAVGFGIIFSLIVSKNAGSMSEAVFEHLIAKLESPAQSLDRQNILSALDCKTDQIKNSFSEVEEGMLGDKKNRSGAIHFVLLSDIGQVVISHEGRYTTTVSHETLKSSWFEFCDYLFK